MEPDRTDPPSRSASPLTERELRAIELDLDSRRRCFPPSTLIPIEHYAREVSRLVLATREQRTWLQRLVIKARVTSEASLVRAQSETDAETRGRLLGQARACAHFADKLEWLVGA